MCYISSENNGGQRDRLDLPNKKEKNQIRYSFIKSNTVCFAIICNLKQRRGITLRSVVMKFKGSAITMDLNLIP